MDHRGHVTPERHHTDVVAGLIALFLKLVDDAAHQGHQDALALVALHQFHSLVSGGSGAQDDRHAGNVAGNQGHAQVPDEGVGHMAVAGSLVGRSAVQILQNLNELSAQGSGHAGHKWQSFSRGARVMRVFTTPRAAFSSPRVPTFTPVTA